MHKAFPLLFMEFPLPVKKVPTTRRKDMPLLNNYNCNNVYKDSFSYKRSPLVIVEGTASDRTGKKKGRTVTVTVDDMQKRKNDVKARTTLLLSLPDEHQLRFSKYKTVQELWAAILTTFSGNEATKKTKKNLLKQQYGNFKAKGSKTLEKTFNRLKGNKEVNTASTNVPNASANTGVVSIIQDTACAYIASQSSCSQIKFEDINQIDKDDIEDMDIKWNIALLSIRADRQGSKVEEQAPKALMEIDDMSWTGLPEFKDDIVTDYSRPAPTVESSPDDDQNRNPSVIETEASPSTISPKSFIKFVKENDSPTNNKTDKAETAKNLLLSPNFVMKKNACFNYGDFNHLAYDCSKRLKKGTSRSQNTTHKSFTPRPAVHKPYRPPMRPMRSNMNVVRSQYRAPWVPTVNRNSPLVNRKLSTVNRNFPNANRKFPTSGTKFLTTDMGKKGKAVNPSACWFWKPSQNLSNKGPNSNSGSSQNNIDDKGYWDSGCSRHMKGNISYLFDYEPFDGGYVSFVQGGCKITGKGTIKTGKLEFENVYFVKDPKYYLFSVSQICDNKNSVLFTDSECIVLGRNFKLSDDDNVLLRTPRQHNM
nr:ribonuclease H-like domain-containing protein [Tanacetum cinerariifolium]